MIALIFNIIWGFPLFGHIFPFLHIEPQGIRTMSKHQLRAELGKLRHLAVAAVIRVILKAYPLIFSPEIFYYFQYFIDIRE